MTRSAGTLKSAPRLWLGMVIVALVAAASGLSAQQAGDAATCLGCHGAGSDSPRGTIDAERFAASVHASLGCTMCHGAGYRAFPHTVDEAHRAGDCTSCHQDDGPPYHFGWIVNEVGASVHGKMASQAFACTECHDPHDVLPVHRAANPKEAIAAANRRCLGCHGLEGDAAGEDGRYSLERLIRVHRFLPRLRQHASSARCVECHTPGREPTVHLILSARSAVRDCVECHTANSALLEKYYRHMAEEDRQDGFINAVLLNNYYMLGATRNRRLDIVMWTIFGVSLLGICIHSALRVATSGERV